MRGTRSHECSFNEFKVLVLDVDAAKRSTAPRLFTLGQRRFVEINVGAGLIHFVFWELNFAAIELFTDKRNPARSMCFGGPCEYMSQAA